MQWKIGYRQLRLFLLRLRSKELIVFLFFLLVSTAFWFLSTLNETYETELRVAIALDGVPAKVVVTDDIPDTIKVTIRDKGFNLLRYSLFEQVAPLKIKFSRYANKGGKGIVIPADVQKMMRQRLSESTVIVSVKADHWDFFYTNGEQRRLPVVLNGQIKAAADYYVLRTTLKPDSVDVYASIEAFDTLKAILTEPIMADGLTTSLTKEVELQHVYGTKIIHNKHVNLNIVVDRLTEVIVSVPIKIVNVPEKIMVKTFPARVDLRVTVGMSNAKMVKSELFNVIADYNDIPKNTQERLPIEIVAQPKGIVKAFLTIPEVDYIIEHLAQ